MEQLYTLMHYSRISTDVYWLDNTHPLRLSVRLYRKNPKNNTQRFFYNEYTSKAGTSINLEVSYNLTLYNLIRTGDDYIAFHIDNSNMYQFVSAFTTVRNWILDKENPLFYKDSSKIVRPNKSYETIHVGGLFNTSLEVIPVVRMNQSESEYIPGINVIINPDPEPIFMDVNSVLAFVYFLDKFSMHQTAMSMVAFLGKPEPQEIKRTSPNTPGSFLQRTGAKQREQDEQSS